MIYNWFWFWFNDLMIRLLNFIIIHQHYIVHTFRNPQDAIMFKHIWWNLRADLAWIIEHSPSSDIITKH